MPNRDGTGPRGLGPRTGGGRGNCPPNANTPQPRSQNAGRGRGLGRGLGFGRRGR